MKPSTNLLLVTFFVILYSLICATCIPATVATHKAIIHHTATKDVPISVIKDYHVNVKGWLDVGYNYLIRADGTIETGRPMNMLGAHAKGRNQFVGIALTGHDKFTPEQYAVLIRLLKKLDTQEIEAHHEACPGIGFDMDFVREAIQ